jgi:hypothetical protein
MTSMEKVQVVEALGVAAMQVGRVGPAEDELMAPEAQGELAFASAEAQQQRTAELLGEGAVVVEIPPLPWAMRGRLAEHVDDHIERLLAARGCPSAHLCAWSAMPDDPEARLSDQLFRVRTLGGTRLALAMGTLAAGGDALTPEDSVTLTRLAHTTRHAPLVLLLDDGDMTLGGYAPPMPLTSLLRSDARIEPVPVREEIALSVAVTEATPTDTVVQLEAHLDAHVEAHVEAHVDTHVDAAVAPVAEPDTKRDPARPAHKARNATVGVPVSGPSDAWRGWALALGAAKGPQPLGAFERLFVESYVPLANAIADGIDDARASRAYDEFRRAFERAYTDAFQTFGATNRRPRLVMDAFDLASKQARLHNARSAHVLVVDSMRYDLGLLVRDALAARGTGSLTAETLLFASLPTTTMRQLETLARGIDALRAPAMDEQTESLRGRSAETVRRLRVGSRELYKLDVVPAHIGAVEDRVAHGEGVRGALWEIAEHTADAITRHVSTLAPRTLLYVIGDHGFCIDRRGHVTCGGAAPEEVMVPALAYLVGDLH